MNGSNNLKLIDAKSIAAITTSYAVDTSTLEPANLLGQADRVEVQVDWAGLTGTLDGTVQIQQRGASDMQWVCLQPTEVDPGSMIKTLNTAAGSYVFTLWSFTGENLRILFTKNNCTGGTLNASVGIRL
jgi:hypothetical protein